MIDLFFKLLNFGILLGLLVYVVRKYIVPQLREKIIKDHHDFRNLHDEHRQLTLDQKNLEESIVLQEDHAKALFKKINHWRNAVDLEVEADQNEYGHRLKEVLHKNEEQLKQYVLHKTYQEVAPLVVNKLETELKSTYSDPQKAHAYLEELLKKIAS